MPQSPEVVEIYHCFLIDGHDLLACGKIFPDVWLTNPLLSCSKNILCLTLVLVMEILRGAACDEHTFLGE